MPISTEDLLHPSPNLGIRVDRFEWELLDRELNPIGALHPLVDETPSIRASTDRTIKRTLDGLALTIADAAAIDPIRDRLRPWMVLQNGERFPLGVYLFGDHQRTVSTRADTWQPQLYDQGLILQDRTASSFSIAAGGDINTAMQRILNDVGIMHSHFHDAGAKAGTAIAWPAGTERQRIEDDLAQQQGCLSPYFDNEGVFTCRMAPDPATVVEEFTYGIGRIEADSLIESDDSYQAPNRYVVIGGRADLAISGKYDIPASAPHSFANRGYYVTEVVDLAGVESVPAAEAAARAAYISDSRSWQRIDFSSPLDPRHDLYAIVAYQSESTVGIYLEVEFSMELVAGGRHRHKLARLWSASV